MVLEPTYRFDARKDAFVRVKDGVLFKDNGRGPELEEQFRLGSDGTFSEYAVRGTMCCAGG